MKKTTALAVSLLLLFGSIVCLVGCAVQTTSTDRACPNCHGVGRYGTCLNCAGEGPATRQACDSCSGTSTLLCGYCNGRGTVAATAFSSVNEKLMRDRQIVLDGEKRKQLWLRAFKNVHAGMSEREVLALFPEKDPEIHKIHRERPSFENIYERDSSALTRRVVGQRKRHFITVSRQDDHLGELSISIRFVDDIASGKSKIGF